MRQGCAQRAFSIPVLLLDCFLDLNMVVYDALLSILVPALKKRVKIVKGFRSVLEDGDDIDGNVVWVCGEAAQWSSGSERQT